MHLKNAFQKMHFKNGFCEMHFKNAFQMHLKMHF
jgi:hypothetical protein